MTASPIPASPPRARLWLALTVLTCCFAVYVIVTPLLYHGAAVRWPLAAGAGAADAAVVGALIMIFLLQRKGAATDDALAHRYDQFERQIDEGRAREQQLLQECAGLRAQCASLHGECSALREGLSRNAQAVRQAVEHAVRLRLQPALKGSPVPHAQHEGIGEDLAKLLELAVTAAVDAGDRQESMRAAVVALSRRVQTSAHRLQEEATLMADRHPGDADALEVSMRVDHAAAQQARHAQSMAVLCGEWPAQQWPEPLPLVDVVRAAAGRIIAFQRVEVAGDPDIAAAAPVVEPLIHLIAELLANATQSSPPSTQVPVTVRAVQRGAVIEIHDCGVGLDEHRMALAREIAAGTRPVDVGGLGEIPQTGLAVVGQYVRRHGFRVDLSESVYGGVRVVVGVPAESVEAVESAESVAWAVPVPTAVPEARAPESAITPRPGLPRRHSPRHAGTPVTAHAIAPAAVRAERPMPDAGQPLAHPEQPPAQTPEQAGAFMGAFLGGPALGTRSGAASDSVASADAEDIAEEDIAEDKTAEVREW